MKIGDWIIAIGGALSLINVLTYITSGTGNLPLSIIGFALVVAGIVVID